MFVDDDEKQFLREVSVSIYSVACCFNVILLVSVVPCPVRTVKGYANCLYTMADMSIMSVCDRCELTRRKA